MKFINFPGADTIIGKGQKEYNPIPAKHEAHNRGRTVMCAEFSPVELEQLNNNGGRFFIELLTFNHAMQPIRFSIENPEGEKIKLRVNYNSDAPKQDHTGHYIVKGYLSGKSTVVPGGTPRRSWQQIHKTTDRDEHVEKLKSLLDSGEYELEG